MADPRHSGRRRAWQVLFVLIAAAGPVIFAAWRFVMPANPEEATRPAGAAVDGHRQANATTAFEPTDWPVGPIAVIYLGLLVLLAVCAFVLVAAYPDALPDANRMPSVVPPAPRLQTDGAADLKRFRADQDRRLNGYYWIDRQKGIVHIPIEQAMKTLAQKGAPGFPKGPQ